MTHKVGAKGQVVIPKELRELFGIAPGDEVRFWPEGDHLAVGPVRTGGPLKGRFAGQRLLDLLDEERVAEREREARR